MRAVAFATSLAAVLFLSASAARAEDPAPAPAPVTPADAAKKVRGAFPEPAEKGAFSYEMDLLMMGQKVGEVSCSATADPEAKKWRMKFSLVQGPADAPAMTVKVNSTLERNLRLLHEERIEKAGGTEKTTMVIRGEKGFDVGYTEGAKETAKSTAEAPDDATSDEMSALLLFLRMCPADAAKYEVTTFDSDTRKRKTQKVEVKGAGRAKDAKVGIDVEAWVATTNDGEHGVELYLDPKDRGFVALKSDQGIWLVKKGLVKAKDAGPVPDYKKAAASAKEAGIKLGMGIMTGDIDVIGEAFHWKSMAEMFKEMGMELDEESTKMMMLEQMKAHLKDMKPEAAWPLLKGAMDGAEEKKSDDGVVEVKVGGMFPTYKAKELEGKWLIVHWDILGGGK